jgi:zinc protease
MRVSNVAYVPSALRLEELVYQGYWPYEHSTIGSMSDLDAAKLEWVQEFFAKHYAPNNAVLTISGDFDTAEAQALVRKYFDPAKRAELAPFDDVPFPEQTSQRTAVVRDAFARTPGIIYGWAVPPFRSPDHYALEMASVLLGHGESSRLHQLLVRDRSMALEASAMTEDRRGPDLFVIDVKLAQNAKVGDVERLVEGEIKSLATRGPTDAEMEKARRRAQAAFVLGLQSNVARATRLGEYEVFYGDARLINTELDHYFAVTKDDVKRVVAQHLGPTRRTIVETYPADAPAAAGPKMGTSPAVSAPAGGQKKAGKGDGKGAKKPDAKKPDAKKPDAKKPDKKDAKKPDAKKKKN